MADSAASQSKRKRLLLIAKLAVTLVLCSIIVWKADWERIGESLQRANGLLVGIVLVCMVLCVTISTYKWQLLLRIHGARFDFGWLHRLYFISMFFNNFLPTSIGGDGYRIYKTMGNERSKTSAFIAVFMERFSGIASLLIIGFCGGVIGHYIDANPLSWTAVLIGLIAAVVGAPFIFLAFSRRFMSWLVSLKKFPTVLRNVIDHFGDYRRESGTTAKVILVSFCFHFFTIWWLMTLVESVGGSIQYYDLAVVSAVLSVVAVIPLSINGLGLIDGTFIYIAGFYGVDYEIALMTMLLQRVLLLPISVAGGLFYFFDKQRAPTLEAEKFQQETALRSEN